MRNAIRLSSSLLLLLLAGGGATAVAQDDAAPDAPRPTTRSKLIYVDSTGEQKVIEGNATVVNRGYLGVELTELTPELRVHFGAPENAGVMIARVVPGSPADKAGLKVGDILTALDGKPMTSSWDVRAAVRSLGAGAQLALDVQRDGKSESLSATVIEKARKEVDWAPLIMKTGDDDRVMTFRLPGAADGTPGLGALPQLRLQTTPREELLEKRLKALQKRLDELESRLPKN
jgi:membrane-associated protease RseP (regulator of RpoE activity)